ncbi:hypothetical protein BB560_000576 [Smittium megazygosporum]|uniref:PH domain-containing protein n=1 Tax=Smittium megazygosporum TaxID=133381 RepID=A0A2T9Z2E1_9FUNG|nr:hypothetical protein BB560_005617 [Smittium megazygosporum]PVV04904.1 hypothetical protein BB560_000576 [Smittium megazygosporum]
MSDTNGAYSQSEKYLLALKAFKTGDLELIESIVPAWVDAFKKAKRLSQADPSVRNSQTVFEKSTPMHLAVQCASYELIESLLSFDKPRIPLNVKDGKDLTELHYAIKVSRLDVVNLLLTSPKTSDVKYEDNKDLLQMAVNPEMEQLISEYLEIRSGEITTELFRYAMNKDSSAIEKIISDKNNIEKINFLARRNTDGKTLLHIAAENDLVPLAEWAIKNGADIFIKDFKGNVPFNYSKSTQMKKLFALATSNKGPGFSYENAPSYSGQLEKWTNYASGWKSRWFELESGILSYYRTQNDAENLCKGAINLKLATVMIHSKHKRYFDIVSKKSVKYQLKAKTEAEAKIWIHLLNMSKQWALDRENSPALSVPSKPGLDGSSFRSSAQVKLSKDSMSVVSTESKKKYPHSVAGAKLQTTNSLARLSLASIPENPDEASDLDSHTLEEDTKSMVTENSDSESLDEQTKLSENFFKEYAKVGNYLRILKMLNSELQTKYGGDTEDSSRDEIFKLISNTTTDIEGSISKLDDLHEATNKLWKLKVSSEHQRLETLTETLQNAVLDIQKYGGERQPLQADSLAPIGGTGSLANIEPEQPTSDDEDIFADASEVLLDSTYSDLSKQPVSAALVKVDPTKAAITTKNEKIFNAFLLDGYRDLTLRDSLPLSGNKKPSLNLWSIIKSAVGKDLSRISVPVFFNEPLSFLQRFTEDLEYSNLLDIASKVPKSSDRTMLVAAFAISNYSSTFGRIAKPFNPLLGETFEYVRPDLKYRAFSEQVVHHPPISAFWVEGQNYDFHASTVMKSKFTGRSMDISPDCTCHLYLKLPIEFLKNDPEAFLKDRVKKPVIDEKNGIFIEHYSWDKLSTSVNGIITGNFWIEHYGTIDVKNHSTGDVTTLLVKKSGWLGGTKFEVTGNSRNRIGNQTHTIEGNWINQILAQPVTNNQNQGINNPSDKKPTQVDDSFWESSLKTEGSEPSKQGQGVDDSGPQKDPALDSNSYIELPNKDFMLWRKNKPHDPPPPYNFTSYALTLNDLPEELVPYIAPTDSRFRPDQQAMEVGEYNKADAEKHRLEEKQRAVRRRRENNEIPPWKPRWFVEEVDQDTGSKYWKFTGEYWTERQRVAELIASGSKDAKWKDVPDIF